MSVIYGALWQCFVYQGGECSVWTSGAPVVGEGMKNGYSFRSIDVLASTTGRCQGYN